MQRYDEWPIDSFMAASLKIRKLLKPLRLVLLFSSGLSRQKNLNSDKFCLRLVLRPSLAGF